MVELRHKMKKACPRHHTHKTIFYNSFLLSNIFILLESQCVIIIMKCLPTKDISYNVISIINHFTWSSMRY